jgi:hypothetical protein
MTWMIRNNEDAGELVSRDADLFQGLEEISAHLFQGLEV